jgi:hypothetical protein
VLKTIGLVAGVLGFIWLFTHLSTNQFPAPEPPKEDHFIAPSEPAAQAGRIDPGVPNMVNSDDMIPGRAYWVDIPDGRHILINYRGTVPFANALPRQPAGGANNAAYYDSKSGNLWIWTVPAGTSNVPMWIDP